MLVYQIIDITDEDLHRITGEAIKALIETNIPPRLYLHGNQIVRLDNDRQAGAVLRPVTTEVMRYELAKNAKWMKADARGGRSVYPPLPVVQNVLVAPELILPLLDQVVETPIFAPDGRLLDRPKYHVDGRVAFLPPPSFQMRSVSENPDQTEICEARDLLLEDLLGDFPFEGKSDRAHAMAALLLPFARLLIDGPTPFHLIDKPAPGTGATLLAQSVAYVASGRELPTMTEAKDEEEWRRRLLAKLLTGARIVLIDNITKQLSSSALAGAITSAMFEDRLIRSSSTVRVPVRCLWLATGNNTALSNDIARRTVRIRLDACAEQPWLRRGFRHPDLRGWTKENHTNLMWAALTLIRSWLIAGQPSGTTVLGMFEMWSKVMGGILGHAGIDGFLSELNKTYAEIDEDTRIGLALTSGWWSTFGEQSVKAAQLVPLTGDIVLDEGDELRAKIKLGKLLTRLRDRQFGGVRIVRSGERNGSQLWRLVPSTNGVAKGGSGSGGDSSDLGPNQNRNEAKPENTPLTPPSPLEQSED